MCPPSANPSLSSLLPSQSNPPPAITLWDCWQENTSLFLTWSSYSSIPIILSHTMLLKHKSDYSNLFAQNYFQMLILFKDTMMVSKINISGPCLPFWHHSWGPYFSLSCFSVWLPMLGTLPPQGFYIFCPLCLETLHREYVLESLFLKTILFIVIKYTECKCWHSNHLELCSKHIHDVVQLSPFTCFPNFFITSSREFVQIKQIFPSSPQGHIISTIFCLCDFTSSRYVLHINGVIQYWTFYAWLISLSKSLQGWSILLHVSEFHFKAE